MQYRYACSLTENYLLVYFLSFAYYFSYFYLPGGGSAIKTAHFSPNTLMYRP